MPGFGEKTIADLNQRMRLKTNLGDTLPLILQMALVQSPADGYTKSVVSANLSGEGMPDTGANVISLKQLSAFDYMRVDGPAFTFHRPDGVEVKYYPYMQIKAVRIAR